MKRNDQRLDQQTDTDKDPEDPLRRGQLPIVLHHLLARCTVHAIVAGRDYP